MEAIRCVKCKRQVITMAALPAGIIIVRRCIACGHAPKIREND